MASPVQEKPGLRSQYPRHDGRSIARRRARSSVYSAPPSRWSRINRDHSLGIEPAFSPSSITPFCVIFPSVTFHFDSSFLEPAF